jgi:hypothetical protein
VREALVGHVDLRLGVAEDVGDLGTDQVPVDRGDVVAALEGREAQRDLLDRVRQRRSDVIAALETGGAQPVRDLVHELVQLAVADLPIVGVCDGHAIRRVFGDRVETEGVAHGGSPAAGGLARGPSGVRQITGPGDDRARRRPH